MLQNICNCPVCDATDFEPFLTCKDYTVSQELFNIVSCRSCSFKFTNPRPIDSEIGKYYKSEDYVSHTNNNKGLINKLYLRIRSYTIKKKLDLISKYVSRGTILDYGCGIGMFLKTCKDAGWKAHGFEPDSEARAIAIKHGLGVEFNKEQIAKEMVANKFDIITLWHVLEHVTDLKPTLQFFSEFLAEQGRLIIAVPNYKSYDAQLYKEFWAGYDVPRHIYHFDLDTIVNLLSRYGFKHEKSLPMKFDSTYVCMLSEKYKTGSIGYLSALINGITSNLKAKDANSYSSVIYIFKKA